MREINLEVQSTEQENDYLALMKCIDIVDDWVEQTKQAGLALEEIQREKYYKHWYPSFKEFTKEVWGISYDMANNLIKFSRTARILEMKGEKKLLARLEESSANVAKALGKKMSEGEVVEVVRIATNDGEKTPTQNGIRAAATKNDNLIFDEKNDNIIFSNDEIISYINNINNYNFKNLWAIIDGVSDIASSIEWMLGAEERIRSMDEAVKDALKFDGKLDKALKYMKLDKEVDREKLKQTYKVMAKIHHPDRGGSEAEFQELQDNLKVIEEYINGKERISSKVKQ